MRKETTGKPTKRSKQKQKTPQNPYFIITL